MTTFADGESGASVRGKINAAISTVDLLNTGDNLLLAAAERTKLTGIATGATANSSDATLLDRANHTGTQASSTLSDSTVAGQAMISAADAAAQAALLPAFGTATKGVVPASGGGTTNYLRADGTFAVPPGGSGIAWSDAVNANLVPDTDGTRDVGTAANRFAEGHFDAVFIGTTQLDGTTLADPGADRILGWDDSGGTTAYFTPGTGLSIIGTDLNAEVSLAGVEALTNKTLTDPKVTFAASAQGTKTTGTFTPDPADGSMQTATNGGAHTLGVPASDCSLAVLYTNNGSAGAITTSAYSMVTGDALTTTDTQAFMFYIIRIGAVSHLNVVAMQ